MSNENLVEYETVYRDGNLWIVVETGMPKHNVKIGIGDTLAEAYTSKQSTPIQSVGSDSGLKGALVWANYAGMIGDIDTLEEDENAELSEDDI